MGSEVTIALCVYFGISGVVTGWILGGLYDEADTIWLKFKLILLAVLGLFITVPGIIMMYLIEIPKFISNTFQLRFWWDYLFTRELYDLPQDKIDFLKRIIKINQENPTYNSRLIIYCANLILKRNAPPPLKPENDK